VLDYGGEAGILSLVASHREGNTNKREREQAMPYKYELGDTFNMSHQELLTALMAKEVAPRTIVGTGYKNGRQVAIDYLKEMIEREGKSNDTI
jgi:hypothetical protein